MPGSVQTRFPRWVQTLESARKAPEPSRASSRGSSTHPSRSAKGSTDPGAEARSAPSTSCQLRANTRSRMTSKRAGSRYQAPGSVRARRMSSSITAPSCHNFRAAAPAWMNRCFDGSDARAVDPAAESVRTFPEPGQKAASPVSLAGVAAHPLVLAGAWVACVLLLHAIVAAVHYPLRDADSTLYESISEQLSRRPVREWIAPFFPPGRFKEGIFLEHLAAFFWPAAALGKLGFARGALLANFLYFLGSLYLLFRLAAALANHENPWGLAYLGGFWCLQEMPRSRWFGLGLALFGLFAFAMKGILGLSFWPVMIAWWVIVSRRRKDAVWFALGAFLIALFSGLYELAYRRVTGQGFFAGYLGTQIGYVSFYEQRPVWGKLVNPFYYLAHLLWFSFPGSLLAAWGIWRSRRRADRSRPTSASIASCASSSDGEALQAASASRSFGDSAGVPGESDSPSASQSAYMTLVSYSTSCACPTTSSAASAASAPSAIGSRARTRTSSARAAPANTHNRAASPSGPVSARVDSSVLCAQVRMGKPGSTRS